VTRAPDKVMFANVGCGLAVRCMTGRVIPLSCFLLQTVSKKWKFLSHRLISIAASE